jgi:hypothetical protein
MKQPNKDKVIKIENPKPKKHKKERFLFIKAFWKLLKLKT